MRLDLPAWVTVFWGVGGLKKGNNETEPGQFSSAELKGQRRAVGLLNPSHPLGEGFHFVPCGL